MKSSFLFFLLVPFFYNSLTAQLPNITTFFPISGQAKQGVYITGGNFINVLEVQFNGIPSPQFYVASPYQLYATVPDAAITGQVSVITSSGNATSTRNFTIVKDTSVWLIKAPLANVRAQHCAIATNNKMYVFGGWDGNTLNATTEIYDPINNTWSLGANIPSPARGMCFTLGTDSMIYAISGGNSLGNATTNVFRYNPTNNTWVSRANIAVGVYEAAAASVNGKIYVFGGDGALGSTRIYDINTSTWAFGSKIPKPVMQHAAIVGNDGRIYLIGGRSTQTSKPWGAVQIYDPIRDLWRVGASMRIPKVQFGAAKSANGKIYVIGGKAQFLNNAGPFFNTIEIYDPTTDTWADGKKIPVTSGELKAVNLQDNIYAMGGTNGSYLKSTIQLIIAPIAPSNLAALPLSTRSIKLTWTDNSRNEERFRIERATSNAGPFKAITNKIPNSTTAVDYNVLPNTTYYYQLKAYNSAGFSPNSNMVVVTTPRQKSMLQKDEKGESPISLTNHLWVNPNPAKENTNLFFTVEQSQFVRVNVYDLKGAIISKLFSAYVEKGKTYRVIWNVEQFPSGTYIAQLIMKNGAIGTKIVKQ